SQGRTSIEYLDLDDILVIEDYRGQRAFYWALDKSRSMDSAEKLGMLSIAVMAGISAVQKDDFGVLLFDSETRVMKRITDHLVPADKIALGLLEVRAGGGTGGREAMRLALHDLRLSGARDKFFIFSSDMYLSDLPQCIELARQMAEMNIRVRLVVPSGSYDRQAAEQLARASRGVIVDIGSLEELPVRLLRLTDY
ncbi:MAG: vWA domain-containing protein, partial [Candidatus Thorarchaeota archaeon]